MEQEDYVSNLMRKRVVFLHQFCVLQSISSGFFSILIFQIKLVIPKAINPNIPKKEISASRSQKSEVRSQKSDIANITSNKIGTKLQIRFSAIFLRLFANSRKKPFKNPRRIIGIRNMAKIKPIVLISPLSTRTAYVTRLTKRSNVPTVIAADVFILSYFAQRFAAMSSCGQDSREFSANVKEVKEISISGDTNTAISHDGC